MLAFGEDPDKNEPLDAYQIFDLIMDLLFCIDVVLSFCTAYVWQVNRSLLTLIRSLSTLIRSLLTLIRSLAQRTFGR
jgi:hypothetical protein